MGHCDGKRRRAELAVGVPGEAPANAHLPDDAEEL